MKSLIPWKRKEQPAAPAFWNDGWLERSRGNPFQGLLPSFEKSFLSRVLSLDVSEDKNEVTVRAEVPGMNEKEIDLTWQDGVLRIRGKKKNEREEKKKDRYYRECRYGSFSRDIALGDSVDWKKAKASYRHGVLTVKLPKTEVSRQSIEIKVN
jgi:HSP20 family protein